MAIELLCVDDDESIRLILNSILKNAGYTVTMAHDGRQALQLVQDWEPSLVILDLEMPGMTGLEVCRELKRNLFTSRIPVLMLTAQSDIEQKVEGFDAGVDDYLAKPFHPRELVARIEALLRMVRRESDRNPTSGLPGGRGLQDEIARRVQKAEPFALCYIDLDHFKAFADNFGFTIADTVIRDTGAAIYAAVQTHGAPADFAGHIGGDDFLVVTHPDCARAIAEDSAHRFTQLVARVVGEDATQRGTFAGRNRDGQEQQFPLAHLTTVILHVAPHSGLSIGHLGTFAADLKRNARLNGGGTITETSLP
jgi:PleD family two-component response regulator